MTNRTHADEARKWLNFALDDTDAGQRAEYRALAQVHALLAIAEAMECTRTVDLAAPAEEPLPELRDCVLDESDHRDRLDREGQRWMWRGRGWAWCPPSCGCDGSRTLADIVASGYGPLAFAPEAGS